jgi:hypothetical protein
MAESFQAKSGDRLRKIAKAARQDYTPGGSTHKRAGSHSNIFPSARKGESAMQALRKLLPGQKGTKKFVARYGQQLFCVRYRYSRTQRKRYTTVELIVAEADWSPPSPWIAAETIIGVRVGLRETELQGRIRKAGGRWNRSRGLWELRYDQAVALGLSKRIEKDEVSDTRHRKNVQ